MKPPTRQAIIQTMAVSFAITFFSSFNLHGQEIEWAQQFGALEPSSDSAEAIGVDGNIYVVGSSPGSLPGQTSAGGQDAFIRKYDSAGNELWTRQFGTTSFDLAFGVAIDTSGVYVVGWTSGSLSGQTSAGGQDAFVRKYDPAGNELWTRQFGTSSSDVALSVAADATGLYVAGSAGSTGGALPGQTSAGGGDAFVRKYDSSGNELWTRQFGSSSFDTASTVAVDVNGVHVAGRTDGTLPGQINAGGIDAFVRKYDLAGNELWTRQFGSSFGDLATGVAVDAGEVHVAGWTHGSLPDQTSAGGTDAFVRKYDPAGGELWTRQFGTSANDSAHSVTADASGVYVAGGTDGTLPGQTSAGGADAFVRKYDLAGNESWNRQFGSSSRDTANSVAVDGIGYYVAGSTFGTLPGQTSSGGADAFLIKFGLNQPPIVGSISAPLDPVLVDTEIITAAGFVDPNIADTHTAVWDWGDGSPLSAGNIVESGGTGTVFGSHVYTVPGVYSLQVTVVDNYGASSEARFDYVVVYDPEGGFVTGGGWIHSPRGALHPGLLEYASIEGKAAFGFVSKYLKGANVPTGNTEFQFKAGNLNFKSARYQWLVVAGARAQFKGWGSINGEDEYAFILTAIDGQVSGGGGSDRFRIKIWHKESGEIIYDNQAGTDDNGELADSTVIGGGSIVIHGEASGAKK